MAVTFRDIDGTTRLAGDLLIGGTVGDVATVQANGTIGPAPGGSQPPTERGSFSGNPFAAPINNGSVGNLNWEDQGLDGGPVVDLTDPTLPAVLAAGVYNVSAYVEPNGAMTEDGFYRLTLILDNDNDAVEISNESRLATAAQSSPGCFVANTYYIPEGGTIRLRCRNRDGASAIVFAISTATIQRIS